MCKDLSEEYERLVNPEKAQEDSKPIRIKEEPMSDISFPVSEEPEADLASGDQALPMGVLGTHNERLTTGLDADGSPHTSGEIPVKDGWIATCPTPVLQSSQDFCPTRRTQLSGSHLPGWMRVLVGEQNPAGCDPPDWFWTPLV